MKRIGKHVKLSVWLQKSNVNIAPIVFIRRNNQYSFRREYAVVYCELRFGESV